MTFLVSSNISFPVEMMSSISSLSILPSALAALILFTTLIPRGINTEIIKPNIVTIAGFIISVLIPLCVKLYNKIKDAKEDGKVDKEEMEDIIYTGKEILDETKKVIDEVKDKHADDK